MNKVLITGACGYLGARLCQYLAKGGYKVTAFDKYNPSEHSQWISLMDEVIVGDIRDESMISDLADRNFDVVIHLISLDHHKSESSPNLVQSIYRRRWGMVQAEILVLSNLNRWSRTSSLVKIAYIYIQKTVTKRLKRIFSL